MKSLSRTISLLRWTILLLMLVLTASVVLFWAGPDNFNYLNLSYYDEAIFPDRASLTTTQRLSGFLVSATPLALLMLALMHLFKVLTIIKDGNWFDTACDKHFQGISRFMIAYTITNILHRTALALVLTFNNPPGERVLSISLHSQDLQILILALTAALVAHMIKVARAQRDELAEII